MNWAIIFPVTVKQAYDKIKRKCTKKTPEEIEAEQARKSIRTIPSGFSIHTGNNSTRFNKFNPFYRKNVSVF